MPSRIEESGILCFDTYIIMDVVITSKCYQNILQKRSRHGHATSIYLPNMTLHTKLPKTTIQAQPPLGSLDSFVFEFGISSSIFRLLSVFEVWDEGIF